MPSTPTYGFPYPSLSDPPNAPAGFQALAEAVETKIVSTDAAVAAGDTALSTSRNLRSLGGRIVTTAGVVHSGVAGTEVNYAKLAFENTAVTQGRVYVLTVKLSAQFNAGDNSFLVRVRKDTALSGTILVDWEWITQVAGFTHQQTFSMPWVATATDADADFYVSVQRISGGGTADLNGARRSAFWIDEVLDGTLWTEVA